MSEFFKNRAVRTVFWVEFLIILALGLHFFTPDFATQRINRLDGRVAESWARVEVVDGKPVLRQGNVLPEAARMRVTRVLPVGVTDTPDGRTRDGYVSRVYCVDVDGRPVVFTNLNNENMGKHNAGEFAAALMHAVAGGRWLDVFSVGVRDYRRRIVPNILIIFGADGSHIVGDLDPHAGVPDREQYLVPTDGGAD